MSTKKTPTAVITIFENGTKKPPTNIVIVHNDDRKVVCDVALDMILPETRKRIGKELGPYVENRTDKGVNAWEDSAIGTDKPNKHITIGDYEVR